MKRSFFLWSPLIRMKSGSFRFNGSMSATDEMVQLGMLLTLIVIKGMIPISNQQSLSLPQASLANTPTSPMRLLSSSPRRSPERLSSVDPLDRFTSEVSEAIERMDSFPPQVPVSQSVKDFCCEMALDGKLVIHLNSVVYWLVALQWKRKVTGVLAYLSGCFRRREELQDFVRNEGRTILQSYFQSAFLPQNTEDSDWNVCSPKFKSKRWMHSSTSSDTEMYLEHPSEFIRELHSIGLEFPQIHVSDPSHSFVSCHCDSVTNAIQCGLPAPRLSYRDFASEFVQALSTIQTNHDLASPKQSALKQRDNNYFIDLVSYLVSSAVLNLRQGDFLMPNFRTLEVVTESDLFWITSTLSDDLRQSLDFSSWDDIQRHSDNICIPLPIAGDLQSEPQIASLAIQRNQIDLAQYLLHYSNIVEFEMPDDPFDTSLLYCKCLYERIRCSLATPSIPLANAYVESSSA